VGFSHPALKREGHNDAKEFVKAVV